MTRRTTTLWTLLWLGMLAVGGCAVAPQRTDAEPTAPAPAALPRATETSLRATAPDGAGDAIRSRLAQLIAQGHAQVPGEQLGYYLDVLQARLQQIGGQNLRVQREPGAIRVLMSGSAGFAVGSSELLPDGIEWVARLAGVLHDYHAMLIVVHGHTDDSGNAQHNQRLSEQRAMAVARQLQRAGIAQRRLLAVGHGPSQPMTSNASEAGRERNRRVEFALLPISP